MRELLADGRLPQSWIPPAQVREIRVRLELYKDLREEHTAWVQRIHATLFHRGAPPISGADGRRWPAVRARLAAGEGLSVAGTQAVRVALRMLDALEAELDARHRELAAFSRRQRGCKELATQYGVGAITSVAIWAMMGDTRRFSASRKAVRHTGLDVTVHSSDGKRAAGHLSRQGPPVLRWALYEAGYCAARRTSPDHVYHTAVRERIDGNRAALSMARKIAHAPGSPPPRRGLRPRRGGGWRGWRLQAPKTRPAAGKATAPLAPGPMQDTGQTLASLHASPLMRRAVRPTTTQRQALAWPGVRTGKAEGNTAGGAIASRWWAPRGQRTRACTEPPSARTGRSHPRPPG